MTNNEHQEEVKEPEIELLPVTDEERDLMQRLTSQSIRDFHVAGGVNYVLFMQNLYN